MRTMTTPKRTARIITRVVAAMRRRGVPSIKDQANRSDGIGRERELAFEGAKGSRRRNKVSCGSAMPTGGIGLTLSKIPIDSAAILFSPFSHARLHQMY